MNRFNLLGEEIEIKLEHLQGYLYAQQEIENTVLASSGSQKEYSIELIEDTGETSSIRLLATFILNRIQFNEKVTQAHRDFLVSSLTETHLDDWENQLKPILHNWFADKHLGSKYVQSQGKAYQSKFEDWSGEQTDKYKQNLAQSTLAAEARIENEQAASARFIGLLKTLGQPAVYHYTISDSDKKNPLYSPHMNFTWGWEYDLLIIKSQKGAYLLHLAMVLT